MFVPVVNLFEPQQYYAGVVLTLTCSHAVDVDTPIARPETVFRAHDRAPDCNCFVL